MNSISLSDAEQVSLNEATAKESTARFDLAVIAFGTDSRSTELINLLRNSIGTVIAGCDDIENAGAQHLANFKKRQRADVLTFAQISDRIVGSAEEARTAGLHEFSVVIDVSCLQRVHMGRLFASVKAAAQILPIRLSIGYCLARYANPPNQRFRLIRRVAPIHQVFAGWGAPPSLPVDVIVGLGYENGKALGAVEYLEPRRRWVFVPNSPEERFLEQVKKHNSQLIEHAADTVIDYDVMRPVDTYYKLLSLVVGLASESRPILLPFGPKLFVAISLLVAMCVEKAAVWHVDGDDESVANTPQVSNHSVLFTCKVQLKA